jgi:MFS family permease
MIKRTIFLYLFFASLFRFAISFIAATYVVFLMSRGLNLFQIGVVNAVFYTTLLICEIPTGVFADIFGRKISYVLSYFLLSISMLVYSISNSFLGFIFAEALGAVGGTFANGAFKAWLKDRLTHYGYSGDLKTTFSKESQIAQIAGGISALLGALLGAKDLALPWVAGGLLFFVGGLLAMAFIKEEYFEKKKFSLGESVQFTKEAIKKGFNNKVIYFVVVMTLTQILILQAPNMQWQPFFSKFLPEKSSLGYVYLGISASIIIGSFFSSRILKKMKNNEKKFLIASQILMGLGILFAGIPQIFFASLFIFLLHEFARGLYAPIKDDYINQSIPEKTKERSILLSLESMSHHIGGVIGLVLSGLLAQYLSIPVTWFIFGGLLVVVTLWISKNGKK